MKRVVLTFVLVLSLAALALAGGKDKDKDKDKKGAQATPPAAAPPAPVAGKMPPQAKTQEEFKAVQEAYTVPDAAAAEKAADDFAAKFPDSELRVLLYRRVMTMYQNANNAEKTVEMGRKVLTLDPRSPEALVTVATVLAERTRDSDLDKDDRLNEATTDAKKALETVDTDIMLPPGITLEQAENAKQMLRSMAWAAMGSVELTRTNYPAAETNLRKSIELSGAQPDPIAYLRLSVVLDHQKKYADALTAANKAMELAPAGSTEANLAKQERDRLVKLTGAIVPATTTPAAAPATTPAAPAPAPNSPTK